MTTQNLGFQRYLSAKRSVDARAFNRQVWATLTERLQAENFTSLRILELGGGTGGMAARILAARLVPQVHYTLVDRDPANIAAARAALRPLANGGAIQLDLVAADVYQFLDDHSNQDWNLLVAHALLDLLDLKTAVPRLMAALKPGGYFYFPINYDGLTAFEPPLDPEFEAGMLTDYNRSMDQRLVDGQPSGDSHTGRHLFAHLAAASAEILAAGPSDWLVFPQGGSYPEDEAFFLKFILATIENEMSAKPEIDQARLQAWLERRRAQVSHADLIYLAHQLDFFGRRSR